MKILTQNYANGELSLVDVPGPAGKSGMLTVQTAASLVSIGTERSMIDVARKSLLGKALARPDWVRQVIDKVKAEGLMEAWRQSKARLDTPMPLGYSSAGVVTDVGAKLEGDFAVGDRVACTGSGYAAHAEKVMVPPNLCAKIPDNVSFEDASYCALGGIAMEAVRLARVELGHKVMVIGLGLLGQITVQLLSSAGCHVFGVDISGEKCGLAVKNGAEATAVSGEEDTLSQVQVFTSGQGMDSVIIMAAAKDNGPLELAANSCRERGNIVASGLVGLDVPRKPFFEKELNVCVSRAWGPGVLDPDYEEKNVQWPFAYARWTASRNIEEFLKMLSLGRVKVDTLTTHTYPFEKALEAYQTMLAGKEPVMGLVLQYPEETEAGKPKRTIQMGDRPVKKGDIGVGLIGAGLFARGTLLPLMKGMKGVRMEAVATAGGLSGNHIANSFKFNFATTDYKELLENPNVDLVFVLTRHGSHATFVCEALKADKAVFVEKPLAISPQGLQQIVDTYAGLVNEGKNPFLMAGFNRRFAPASQKAADFIKDNGGQAVVQIRCNAGHAPANSWVHGPEDGGGRVIGEVCHFIDLASALTGGLPERVFAALAETPEGTRDNLGLTMQMDNNAAVSITYASNGDKAFPREEVQIFAGGGVCVIHNFKDMEITAGGKRKYSRSLEVDRGHKAELQATFEALKSGGPSPISFESLAATTRATFAVEESISNKGSIFIEK